MKWNTVRDTYKPKTYGIMYWIFKQFVSVLLNSHAWSSVEENCLKPIVLLCVLNISHGYMNYIHRVGRRNSCMNIPWPITICSYLDLLTMNAAFVLSSWSFKCLFYSSQIVKSFTHMTLFRQCCPQATNLLTELHTLGNCQKSIAIHTWWKDLSV